eukprot:2128416-Alexandrium_andersonii.AAC.1
MGQNLTPCAAPAALGVRLHLRRERALFPRLPRAQQSVRRDVGQAHQVGSGHQTTIGPHCAQRKLTHCEAE